MEVAEFRQLPWSYTSIYKNCFIFQNIYWKHLPELKVNGQKVLKKYKDYCCGNKMQRILLCILLWALKGKNSFNLMGLIFLDYLKPRTQSIHICLHWEISKNEWFGTLYKSNVFNLCSFLLLLLLPSKQEFHSKNIQSKHLIFFK